MPSSVRLRWAIDWDDTGEVVPFSEAVVPTQTGWGTGPRLGSLQTPQPTRGSFQLYDPTSKHTQPVSYTHLTLPTILRV